MKDTLDKKITNYKMIMVNDRNGVFKVVKNGSLNGSSVFSRDTLKVARLYRQTMIYEYDLTSANTSIMKFYDLAPKDQIVALDRLPKDQRNIKVGILRGSDPELSKRISRGFCDARTLFGTANKLTDQEIVSIKKDAIFTTRRCSRTEFINENNAKLIFRCKNKYTTCFPLSSGIEIFAFYDELDDSVSMDVKGIRSDQLELHKDGMLIFLERVVKIIERGQREYLIRYIRDFYDQYRKLELPISYYRTFDPRSRYELIREEDWGILDEEDLDKIKINFNIEQVILPLIQISYQMQYSTT